MSGHAQEGHKDQSKTVGIISSVVIPLTIAIVAGLVSVYVAHMTAVSTLESAKRTWEHESTIKQNEAKRQTLLEVQSALKDVSQLGSRILLEDWGKPGVKVPLKERLSYLRTYDNLAFLITRVDDPVLKVLLTRVHSPKVSIASAFVTPGGYSDGKALKLAHELHTLILAANTRIGQLMTAVQGS